MTSILTTHVGSLPRSKELSELLFAKDKGEEYSKEKFNEVLSLNVDQIVKRQLEVGIDFISDGEMSKISYATYIKDRIDGFSGESERRAPADLDDFPEYKEKIAKSGGTPTYSRPCCTHELKIKDEILHCSVSTNDNYGFIKFLLLLNDEIEIINIKSTVNLKELLNVKKN